MDGMTGERAARAADGVKRLGDEPVVFSFAGGDAAAVEIAARGEHATLLRGPYGRSQL
jgi:hypothetical protein